MTLQELLSEFSLMEDHEGYDLDVYWLQGDQNFELTEVLVDEESRQVQLVVQNDPV